MASNVKSLTAVNQASPKICEKQALNYDLGAKCQKRSQTST